jgi:hypothetical protein
VGNDEQARKLRKPGVQIDGEAVCEYCAVAVRAEIGEVDNRERGLLASDRRIAANFGIIGYAGSVSWCRMRDRTPRRG